MQSSKTIKNITHYYEQTEIDYKLLWHLKNQLAMHYGFWGKNIQSLPRALENQNKVMAEMVHITANDHVLDAGCGVGGSSLYLARTIKCHVTGISLVGRQVASATRAAQQKRVSDLATFEVADFTATPFPDNSFDVVWAIESVCYAEKKRDFLAEAFRILKPGGRLIVADGFRNTRYYEGPDKIIMDTWLKGWGVVALDTLDQFCATARDVGFISVSAQDQTDVVMPSSALLYRYSFLTAPADWLTRRIGWRKDVNKRNLLAARYQYKALRRQLWQYATVCAIRPD